MSEGRARLRAVERGQVSAYLLGPWLAYMQPGADRANDGTRPAASSTANACAARACSGPVPGMHSGAPPRAVPVSGSRAARMISMSSS